MVRHAQVSDAAEAGRLLDAFNREFGEPTPGAEAVARRVAALLEADEAIVLLAGDGPDAVLVLRLRPALWAEGLDAYVEELYVVPDRRGQGVGRALMEAAIDLARERGAGDMHVCTSEDDVAARRLYESLGFDNHEHDSDGPVQYFYERELQ